MILSNLRSLNSISKPSLQSCAFIFRCTCPTACSTFPPAGPTDTALHPNSLRSSPLHLVNGNSSGAQVIKFCHPRLPSSFFCLHLVIKSYKSCFRNHSEFTDFLPLCVMPRVQPMDLSLLGSYISTASSLISLLPHLLLSSAYQQTESPLQSCKQGQIRSLLKIYPASCLTQNKSTGPENDLQVPLLRFFGFLTDPQPPQARFPLGASVFLFLLLSITFPQKSHSFLPLLLHTSAQCHLLREAAPYNTVQSCTHVPFPLPSFPCLVFLQNNVENNSLPPKAKFHRAGHLLTLFIYVTPALRRYLCT